MFIVFFGRHTHHNFLPFLDQSIYCHNWIQLILTKFSVRWFTTTITLLFLTDSISTSIFLITFFLLFLFLILLRFWRLNLLINYFFAAIKRILFWIFVKFFPFLIVEKSLKFIINLLSFIFIIGPNILQLFSPLKYICFLDTWGFTLIYI